MRILHLDAGREMRGGQWQALRLVQGLAAAGVESTLLARPGAPLFELARKQGLQVEPWGFARAVMMARRHDLLHAHDARSHTLGALIRLPMVASRRVAFAPRAGPWSGASRWKYNRPARWIAVSEYVKSVLIHRGVPAAKISVVYDGVPLLEPVRECTGPPRILALETGGDARKGLMLAREAAKIAGVALHVTTELERDLCDAAVLVYVTSSEGLGSGALLAMSAAVPVVASNIGGLPEAIRDGENGLLAANQPAAIAAAIRRVVDDPGLRRRMGAAARQTIIDRFTADHMVRRTMEVYRQVLS